MNKGIFDLISFRLFRVMFLSGVDCRSACYLVQLQHLLPWNCYRKYLLVDPNEMEERVMDGKMVIGMNKHRELVTLQLTGSMLLHKDQVWQINDSCDHNTCIFSWQAVNSLVSLIWPHLFSTSVQSAILHCIFESFHWPLKLRKVSKWENYGTKKNW